MKPMDAYIRVSRVGGRDGSEYRTPHIQRAEIEHWLDREGLTLGKVAVDEDTSGGKAVADRKLEGLVQRAERGESGGVIAYRLDRFGRDNLETLKAVKRLQDAGARLVCVADGVDSDQPQSKWMLGIMSLQAEDYLDRVKANWDASTSRAVADGIHIACRAPVGYLRVDKAAPHYDARGKLVRDGRLVPDPLKAAAITMAFEMRARGDTLGAVIEALPFRMVKSTLSSALKNRAYLGEARGPKGFVKEGAHEPLTTPELFERCQPGRTTPRTGVTKGALLGGLITCAGCGHKLRVFAATVRGERLPTYCCNKHYSEGDCPAPAAAYVSKVDGYVVQQLEDSWDDVARSAVESDSAWLQAREDVRLAEEDLEAWTSPDIQRTIARDLWSRGIAERQDRLDAARRNLWDLPEPDVDLSKPVVMLGGRPVVYEVWGEDIGADRRHLRRHIAAVTLAKTRPPIPGKPGWQPTSERVSITWR